MRAGPRLLLDGLRLSLLLRPRGMPLEVGPGPWLALSLCVGALGLGWHWPLVEAPRAFSSYGVQTWATAELLRLIGSFALVAITARTRMFWTVAGWSAAAGLPPTLVIGSLHAWAALRGWPDASWVYWGSLAWSTAIVLRLAGVLSPRARARGAVAALIAIALSWLPWRVLPVHLLWETDWRALAARDEAAGPEPGLLAEPERTMYAQHERVREALAALAPQRPDRTDLYLVAFGGDASEDVFRNEVDYIARLFAQRFDTERRSVVLVNHPDGVDRHPLATATNLERVLAGIGDRIDRERDLVFVYLTSHGSEQHELYINQPPLALDALDPPRLRAALDAAGIGWRVLVVSACYSGGYIDALRDPQTLVLTAARHDRTSFGCGADSDITWFGRAFLAEALNEQSDFIDAFDQARARVRRWEQEDALDASEPQIAVGERIVARLAAWRAEFTPGPALAFDPPHSTAPARARPAPAVPAHANEGADADTSRKD